MWFSVGLVQTDRPCGMKMNDATSLRRDFVDGGVGSNPIPCTFEFLGAEDSAFPSGGTSPRSTGLMERDRASCAYRVDADRLIHDGRGTRVLLHIKTCNLTMSSVMRTIRAVAGAHPEWDLFMDGDLYSICARPRREVDA